MNMNLSWGARQIRPPPSPCLGPLIFIVLGHLAAQKRINVGHAVHLEV